MGELKSLSQVIEGLKEKYPGLVHWRVPACNSAAPQETDFDIICNTLLGSAINTPVIINDQVGLSRATTGCVIACLFKEFQITSSFEGLVETVPGMNLNLLKMDTYKMDMNKDTLFRGEFPVVVSLVEQLGDGVAAKNNADKIIDLNGTKKTGGTGIKQLRENIAESKLSYEIMDDAAQAFLKSKIMDNIHKYFYLILYSAYLRKEGVAARNACDEARPPNKIGEYAELGNVTRDSAKATEVEFLKVCEARIAGNGGKLKVVDINKKEMEKEVKEIQSLSSVIESVKEKFPGLVHMRVPVCNSAAPLEADFDIVTNTLLGSAINTPVIINDQVGLSRATTGCVIACLFKEFQITSSFEGLVETVP